MCQTGLKREQYLEGTIPDVRNILVNYGHWLEKMGIKNEGTLEDYETYLVERDKQLEQQREDEHLEFICWICNNTYDDFPFMLISGEEWDRFQYSDIEDDEMDMMLIDGEEFYDKFKDITGIELLDFDDQFISMTYIDEGNNDIELIVNINGDNKRYIIGI